MCGEQLELESSLMAARSFAEISLRTADCTAVPTSTEGGVRADLRGRAQKGSWMLLRLLM